MGTVSSARGLVVRIAGVGVAAYDRPGIGDQAGIGEALADEVLDFDFLERRAVAGALADEVEGGGAHLVDAAARLPGGFPGLRESSLRLEHLDQLRGGDHFDARGAHQFDGAGVHVGDVGNGAHGRVGHGDLLHAGGEAAERGELLRPTGVGDLLAGQAAERVALDAVLHAHGFALGGDHVIPAARDLPGGQAENAVSQRVAHVVIEEEPPVDILFAKFLLYGSEVHEAAPMVASKSLSKAVLRDTLNLHDLQAACQARDDAHARARHAGEFGEEADAFVVRLAVHGRRGEGELPGVAETPAQAPSASRADGPLR